MDVFSQQDIHSDLHPAGQVEKYVVFVLFLSLILLFSCYPNIDLNVADFFYTPEGWFFNNQWALLIKHFISGLTAVVIIGLLFSALSTLFISWKCHYANKIRFLILALLIGPGLLINFGLKDHWGRARPGHLIQFGGQKNYTAPLQPTNQCKKNCSFVSGHAAMGYSLILLGALTGSRLIWLMGGATLGLVLGLLRMMQGGHFISDVLFAFFPVWFAMELVIFLFWFVQRLKLKKIVPHTELQ